jgi:hypothetical protein
MDGSRKCGIYTNGILLSHEEEWNLTICR